LPNGKDSFATDASVDRREGSRAPRIAERK
jgi:hypothetical protein